MQSCKANKAPNAGGLGLAVLGPLGMKTMPPRLFLGADPKEWPRTGQGEPLRGKQDAWARSRFEAGETQAAVVVQPTKFVVRLLRMRA